jgi:hypothetical protein
VVIDSTVTFSDPRLRRAYGRVVRTHAGRGTFRLVVPEVVVQESVNKLRTRSKAAYEQMKKASVEIDRLGLPRVIPDATEQAANVAEYEEDLRRACSDQGAKSDQSQGSRTTTWFSKRSPRPSPLGRKAQATEMH